MKAMIVALVVTGLAVLFASPNASADETHCVGVLSGVFDNVVVTPGNRCTLSNSVVRGNVKALENSQVVVQGSNIRGNVDGDKADFVQVNSSIVSGSITINEGGPALPPFPAGAVGSINALVFGTIVEEGNVQIQKMIGDANVSFSRILSGNVKIEDNLILAFPHSLIVQHTQVAQNIQVFKNRGSGFKFVGFNTAGENIQCFENSPPFFGGGAGQPNTAPQKEGQCF